MRKGRESMQIGGVMIKKEAVSGIGTEVQKADETEKRETEPSSIGEAGNRNIRTGVDSRYRLSEDGKEEEKNFRFLKERANEKEGSLIFNKEAMTPEMLQSLTEEGISVEESDADLVKESIRHIIENREKQREGVGRRAEELKREREDTEAIALSENGSPDVVKRLKESGLPVTEENVKRLSSAIETAERGASMIDDAAIRHLIVSGLSETPENIYKARHQSVIIPKTTETAKDVLWEEVKEQAEKLLLSQGAEALPEHETAAKWLFMNDLPISADHAASVLSLRGLKEEIRTEEGKERVKEVLTRALSEGKDPMNAVIGRVYEIRSRFFLTRLRKESGEYTEFRSLSAKRALEEIRLKLTEESAIRMLEKGIRLDVSDLQGVVSELRAEEEHYFRTLQSLTEEGRDSAFQKGKEAGELFQSTMWIRETWIGAGETGRFRIAGVTEVFKTEGRVNLSAFHRAGLAYEKGGTKIRSDLGDSKKKAFENIDEVLRGNGFAVTEANRKAVRLLSYSRTEITETSLLKMKEAALLTEEVMRELKPATVAGLIGKGIDPLDMSMEDLLSKVKEMNLELRSEEERFSSFLYKLEKSEGIGEDERKAFIGIYRLLHQIEKSDGAAIGRVRAEDRALTLRNLLSAVRTEKLRGFDKRAEEDFGELVSRLSGDRIDTQIDEAFGRLLAGRLKADFEKENESYLKEKTEEIKRISIRTEKVEKLTEEGAKISLSNLSAEAEGGKRGRKRLLSSMSAEEKAEIRERSEYALASIHDKKALAEGIESIAEAFEKKAEELKRKENPGFREFGEVRSAGAMFALSVNRMKRDTYEIPVLYGEDRILDFSVTFRAGKRENDKGKFRLRIEEESFSVEAEFRLTGERLTGFFRADDREELERLRGEKEALLACVREEGFFPGEISYHLGRNALQTESSDDIYREEVMTADIFRLAKAVSSHILGGRVSERKDRNEVGHEDQS